MARKIVFIGLGHGRKGLTEASGPVGDGRFDGAGEAGDRTEGVIN
jgi:hypothetical protein